MKYVLSALIFTLVSVEYCAQDWVSLREAGANLYEVEQAFDNEWGDQEYVKGRGYKQFHRWKNFWEPRLYPSGSFPNSVDFLNNELRNNKHLNQLTKDAGDWQSLGLDQWVENIGNVPGNGRINVAYVSPGPSGDIYIGTPSGGMWKSTDGGASWIAMTQDIPSLGVSGIAINPNNENIIYISTGDNDNRDTYSVGVLKSTDGGETWNTTGLSFSISDQVRCNNLTMHPENPEILLCGTTAGLYRTEDGGLSWDYVYNGDIDDVKYKFGDPETVFMTKEKFFISTDGGQTWDDSGEELPGTGQVTRLRMAITPANPDCIYLVYAANDYSYHSTYRSLDGGESWDFRSDSPNMFAGAADGSGIGGQSWYDMEICVSPLDVNNVIVGGVNLWESNDGGQNWNLNAYWVTGFGDLNYVHADIHDLEYFGNVLYCASDGGLYRSNNFGADFTDLSAGLVIAQNYRLGIDPNEAGRLFTGAQDNGTNRFEDGEWDHVAGADGFETIVNYDNPNIVYSSSQYGGIRKSTNGGNSFNNSTVGITEAGAWNTPYIMSPLNPEILYAGFENVWRSNDGGDSWTKISSFDDQLQSLAMCMIDPNVIYAASYDYIHKTTEGGDSWTIISGDLPSEAYTYMAVDPMDPDRIWVSISGFNPNNKVFYSDDGGDSWQNISQGLPNVPVNCIVYNSNTDDEIYIGTDQGVYVNSSELAGWESFNINLPNVIVTELEISYDESKLYASTYGRGIWVSDLWNGFEIAPMADFKSDYKTICVGGEIQFEDHSVLNSPGWNWTFEGGEPANSEEMNPVVTYNSPGVYDVTLQVSNDLGTDSYFCEGCVFVYESPGEPIPFIEGFEEITELSEDGWFINDDINGEHWELNSDASASGSQSVRISNYELDVEQVYELYTKPFDLSAENDDDSFYLSFKYAYGQIIGGESDRLRIYTSDDCGESWILKADWVGNDDLMSSYQGQDFYIPNEGSDWIEEIVEIDEEPISDEVMFKFWFRNANGNNLYIDDINIFSGTVGVEEELSVKTVVSPNPAKDHITIRTDNSDPWNFVLYDNLGRFVLSESNSGSQGRLDVSFLPAGHYIFHMTWNDGSTFPGQIIIE